MDLRNDEQLRTMLERLEASNAGQEKYAKKQYRMSQLAALANLAVLAIVIYAAVTLIPQVNHTFENVNVIMEDLNVVTSELAAADIEGMLAGVDGLVNSSEQSIQEAMEKINSIDIVALNEAITNLNNTVKPFADFFGRFQ